VRLIVSDRFGRVLILRRSDAAGDVASWCLPGGRVEYGETIKEAAARELHEETGLRLRRCRLLFDQDSPPLHPGGIHASNLYLECTAEGDVVLGAESVECAWIAPADLAGYAMVFRNGLGLVRYWTENGTA